MAYLSYKTRKHASPQGKPRVYLCLHPDDHALIDAIADEILSEVNCAVFYHTDPITDVEEHLRDLAEMNLFVIPVTTRFLTKPSDALTLDVPFAKDNHIPILPLMQESGLDALFNNVLGELQYLDPRQSDQTAIPYKEKLSQYLSAVLVGDALAEAVRNAFDAYIFLSYRKKDRAYAQELMRLIHENDFCRDVAIWYDEYLIPGENFNDMIASALEKSELFALAVTPNLVNEKNYIMTTEYPMAQKHKKPIVPIEMARTNSLSLKMKYPKLPRVRDCHDPSAVAKALAEALSTIVLRVGDTDPRHNFFIGLAYLSGIDVEKNHDRALSLITFAAEAGLPEAVKKLVTMYQNGEGVARSYETAIVWQKKLVKLYQTAYEDQPSESTAEDLLCALWDYGKGCLALGKFVLAHKAFTMMEQTASAIRNTAPWLSPLYYRGIAYDQLADLAERQGDLAKAKELYLLAHAITEELRDLDPETNDRDLAISHQRLGDIAFALGDMAEAQDHYVKAYTISLAIVKVSDDPCAKRGLATDYDRLAKLAKVQNQLAAARDCYLKALQLREALAGEFDTAQAREDLAISYVHLGDVERELGQLSLALAHYQKAVAIDEAIDTETETLAAKRWLSIDYERLGDVARAQGDYTAAETYYQKSLAMDLALAAVIPSIEAREDLVVMYDKLCLVAIETGHLDEAKAYAEAMQKLAEEVRDATDSISAKESLSLAYNRLAYFANKEGDLAAAEAAFQKALAIDEAILAATDTETAKQSVALGYAALGRIAKNRGDFDTARTLLQKALSMRESLAAQNDIPQTRHDLALSYKRLAELAKAEQDTDTALSYYLRALTLYEDLVETTAVLSAQIDLAVCYYQLGDLYKKMGDIDSADVYYRKAFGFSEAIASHTEAPSDEKRLALCYERLGDVARMRNNLDRAQWCYANALTKRKQLYDRTNDDSLQSDIAYALYKLATVFELRKDKKGARKLAENAESILIALTNNYPDNTPYQRRLALIRKLLATLS